MSRHRTAVRATAERLARAAVDHISGEIAVELCRSGVEEVRLVGHSATEDRLQRLAEETNAILAAAGIEQLQESDVVVGLRYRERLTRCVANGSVSTTTVGVADIVVRARIRTRWVHMWNDASTVRQWPLERGT